MEKTEMNEQYINAIVGQWREGKITYNEAFSLLVRAKVNLAKIRALLRD